MRLSGIVITGAGMVTPVGLSVAASCAALRAAIPRMRELPNYAVAGELFEKEPVLGGRVPTEWFRGGPEKVEWPGHERFQFNTPPAPEDYIPPGVERVVELAVYAAQEAWAAAALERARLPRIGCYLGMEDQDDPKAVFRAVGEALKVTFDAGMAFTVGRPSALAALEAACRDLVERQVDGALVAGVDSLIRAPVLERLERAGILRSDRVPQGIIPGEAAGVVFLETGASAAKRGAQVRGRLLASAVGDERTAGTSEPNRADGLTKVLHAVRRDGGGLEATPLVICDLNGDRYRAMEWAMASIRALGDLHGDTALWHPADCIGDPGAGSGLVNLVWATEAFTRGYAPADRALVWGAADGEARAAVLLAPGEEG